MPIEPEQINTIFTRIRNAIANASNITNFSPNSPERALTRDGFAEEMRERQHEELAAQLSGWIDYAGKQITEDDLNDLNINPDNVDLELLNSYMEESDLDELVKENSISRDPGSFATGQVTFQTSSDSVVIPAGTEVGTEPDSTGDYISFETDNEVTPSSNSTSVTADITAVERGSEGNVGSGSITYLPSPPPGVNSVNNNNSTTGGEDEESTEELRTRAKDVLTQVAAGGTSDGVLGGLVSAFDGVSEDDVVIDEFFNADPQYFDAIVRGGPSDSEIKDKLDELQPVSIEGKLVRPTEITIDVTADVKGTNIDTGDVESDLQTFIEGLGLGEDVIRDQIIQTIMNADDNITDIDSLTTDSNGTSFSDNETIASQEVAVPGTMTVSVV